MMLTNEDYNDFHIKSTISETPVRNPSHKPQSRMLQRFLLVFLWSWNMFVRAESNGAAVLNTCMLTTMISKVPVVR